MLFRCECALSSRVRQIDELRKSILVELALTTHLRDRAVGPDLHAVLAA